MSYSAIVTRLTTRPHPSADRLQLGSCFGYQVVVDMGPKSGDLGVFFPTDGAMSHAFALENNLYNLSAREKLGLPTTADGKYGFFSSNRRIRAQRFRGQRSDGIWLALECFTYTGYDVTQLKEGDTFCELADEPICEKYYTPATRRMMARGQQVKTTRRETLHFRLNPDVPQFRYVADGVKAGSVCYITEKVHGTSARYGRVLDDLPFGSLAKVINRIWPGVVKPKKAWTYLNGSRNVILEHSKNDSGGYYGSHDFRYDAVASWNLHRGETIYFEIVGYIGQQLIMNAQPFPATDIGKLLKSSGYADPMTYSYGCPVAVNRNFIYRITQTNVDGQMLELSWHQMVARSRELGVPTVPLIYGPFIATSQEQLRDLVEEFTGTDTHPEPSTIDPAHIREGVVLRVEAEAGVSHAKSKQFAFGVLEGYLKENDTTVDMEEVA